MHEDDLPSVYVGLCEIQDALLGRLFQRHHAAGRRLHVVDQLPDGGVGILCVQHAGGDISFLPGEDLQNIKGSGRGTQRERG